nr:Ig V-region-like antigen precursor [Gallus gallus]
MRFTSGCNHPSFTLPWRTLLPYLVALHLLQPGSAQLRVVAPSLRVTAIVGQDVVLRCHLCPCKDAWRLDIRWILQRSSGFVHHYQNGVDLGQMEEYKGRTELLRDGLYDGNLDLRITAVSTSDSGSYSCAVQDGDGYADAVVDLEVSDPFSQIVHPWKVALAVVVTILVGSFVINVFLCRKKAAQSRELKRKDAALAELDEISGLSAENLKQLASKLNENADEVEDCNSELKKDCEEMGSGVADLKELAAKLEEYIAVNRRRNVKLNNIAAKLAQQTKELEKQHSQFHRHFQRMDLSAVNQKKLVTKLEEHFEWMERRNVKLEIPAVILGQQAKESEKQKSELKERHEEMAEQTEAVVVDTEEAEKPSEELD